MTCDPLPVAQRLVLDVDGAQLLDTCLRTKRHLVVGHIEGLPLPPATAGGEATVGGGGARGGGRDGGRAGGLFQQGHVLEIGFVGLLVHKLMVLQQGGRRSEEVSDTKSSKGGSGWNL